MQSPVLNPASPIQTKVLEILKPRYLKRNPITSELEETPIQMFQRVANAVAQAEISIDQEKWKEAFTELMTSNSFMPNSPTLMNAGIQGTLSACFVIGVEDTMESILDAVRKAGLVMKFGGGVGYYLGNIRSKNSPIRSTHGKACGPIAVLEQLNQTSRLITQGGKRDGANMAILPINHPDVRAFIHCKDGNAGAEEFNQTIDQFNISLSVPDSFMRAVEEKTLWHLVDPHSNEIMDSISATELWDEIISAANATGDPGLFFVDEVNRKNTTPNLGPLKTTNPCGEVPLYNEEACNLGSINLINHVKNGTIDFERLEKTTKIATRFLDDVVTVNKFPIPEIKDAVEKTRKLGLGVMGWHHLLLELGIPYESDKAVALASLLMEKIHLWSRETSQELAKERGNFPAWEGSIFDTELNMEQRNATTTCIAPTGTISRIAGTSSGIEPIFAWAYESKVMRGQIKTPIIDEDLWFTNWLATQPDRAEAVKAFVLENGTLQNCPELTKEEQLLFKVANEIDLKWHIAHQAAFQKHTDLAVSKTINMPNVATAEDVATAYKLAFNKQCKGITTYRDGSRKFQILNTITDKKPELPSIEATIDNSLNNPILVKEGKKLPWKAEAVRYKIPTPIGVDALIFLVKDDQGYARELVITLGKSGQDILADAEALGRTVTLGLKFGVPIENIHNQLAGITSGRWINFPYQGKVKTISSLADAVALALADFIEDPILNEEEIINGNFDYCPKCSNRLVSEEACMKCSNLSCDYSRC